MAFVDLFGSLLLKRVHSFRSFMFLALSATMTCRGYYCPMVSRTFSATRIPFRCLSLSKGLAGEGCVTRQSRRAPRENDQSVRVVDRDSL